MHVNPLEHKACSIEQVDPACKATDLRKVVEGLALMTTLPDAVDSVGASVIVYSLWMSGDVEKNPGPRGS